MEVSGALPIYSGEFSLLREKEEAFPWPAGLFGTSDRAQINPGETDQQAGRSWVSEQSQQEVLAPYSKSLITALEKPGMCLSAS